MFPGGVRFRELNRQIAGIGMSLTIYSAPFGKQVTRTGHSGEHKTNH